MFDFQLLNFFIGARGASATQQKSRLLIEEGSASAALPLLGEHFLTVMF
jgi:hypothetical protein